MGNGVDAEKLLDENARRFAEKWGLAAANGKRVALRPWPEFLADGTAGVRPRGRRILRSQCRRTRRMTHRRTTWCRLTGETAKVSLTMIVRDEEENLPHCLESVRGIFDEIVVVDTGSTDRTKEIARAFGAKVFDFAWVDDFAAARNEALSHATGDYAFWLDADDVVEPGEREKLPSAAPAIEGRRPGRLRRALRVRPEPGWDRRRDGRRSHPAVSAPRRMFAGRTAFTSRSCRRLRRAKVPVRWTDLTVRHTGYVDQALRARKLDRDIRILERELEDRPDDPFVLFNLGAIAVERREWPRRSGSSSAAWPARRRPTRSCASCLP